MEVPDKFKELTESLRCKFGAEKFYIVDVAEPENDNQAGMLVFGIRKSAVPPLIASIEIAKAFGQAIGQSVGIHILSNPMDEVEYLFDQYLRPYISMHGGIVTPVKIEEESKKLWVNMDGGCSGCPASLATLKLGIERTLKDRLPWVEDVEAINEAVEPDFNIKIDYSANTSV